MPHGVSVLLLAAWLTAGIWVAGPWAFIAILVTFALFALPGLAIGRMLRGAQGRTTTASVIASALAGIVISALVNLSIAITIGWSASITAAIVVAVTLLLLIAARRALGGNQPARASALLYRKDQIFLAVLTAVLIILIAQPLARVGEVADGLQHHYYSLLAQDFLMRGTFSMSVLREVPANDMFLVSQPFKNSLLFYSVVAYGIDLGGARADLDRYVAAADLVLTPAFVLSLLVVARALCRQRTGAWAAVLLGVFASSYYGWYAIAKRVFLPWTPRLQEFLVSRGLLDFSDVSHSWYRDLVVEPHSVLAQILLLIAILLATRSSGGGNRIIRAVICGLLLAGAFASDSFIGLIGAAWYGAVGALWLALADRKQRLERLAVFSATITTFAVTIAWGLAIGLCSLGSESSMLLLRPYSTVLRVAPVIYFLEIGPLLILGLIGLWRGARTRQLPLELPHARALLILLVIAIGCSLFVMHNDPAFEDIVFRKSVKVMILALALLGGGIVETWLESWMRGAARFGRAAVAVAVLAGTVTIVVDVLVLSGAYDGGRTTVVSKADRAASIWIWRNLPVEAVVQSLPQHPDGYYKMAPVAMLGGRAMALGNLKMARVSSPTRDFLVRLRADLNEVFGSADCARTASILLDRGVEYVYVGPREREETGDDLSKFRDCNRRFDSVYDEAGVEIFLVRAVTEETRSP